MYTKSLSFFFYLLILASEIYLYLKLAEDLTKISFIGPIMAYIIIFILVGAFILFINISKEVLTPILIFLSLSSALASFAFYSSSVSFYTYAFISFCCPFVAIFWNLINFISNKRPIFRINAIIICYIMLFIPIMVSVLNFF